MYFPFSSLDTVDGLKETLDPRFLRITLSDVLGEFLTAGLRAVERLCKGEGECVGVCVGVRACVRVCVSVGEGECVSACVGVRVCVGVSVGEGECV